MPELSQLALYCAGSLLLAITPGPGIFYVAARNLAGGRPEFARRPDGGGHGAADRAGGRLLRGRAGFVSAALNTLADIVVAFATRGIRGGAAARPALARRPA